MADGAVKVKCRDCPAVITVPVNVEQAEVLDEFPYSVGLIVRPDPRPFTEHVLADLEGHPSFGRRPA